MRSMVRPSTDLQILREDSSILWMRVKFSLLNLSVRRQRNCERQDMGWTRRTSLNPEVAPSLGSFYPIRTLFSHLPWRTSEVSAKTKFSAQTRSNFKLSFAISIIRQDFLDASSGPNSPSSIHTPWMHPSQPSRSIADPTPGCKAMCRVSHSWVSPLRRQDEESLPTPQHRYE